MSTSWRITETFNDKSQKSLPSEATGTGATVVASSRSLEEPVLFAVGETQRMLNLLGAPTKVEQGLLEAIEYNKSYPLWVVSPARIKKFNYIAIIKGLDGDIYISEGADYLTETSVDTAGTIGAGRDFVEGEGTQFTASIPTENMATSITDLQFYSDGTLLTGISIDGSADSYTIAGSGNGGDGEGNSAGISGTITRNTGTNSWDIVITNAGSYEGTSLRVIYQISMEDNILAIIAQRNVGSYIQGSFSKVILRKGASDDANTYYLSMNYEVLNYQDTYKTGSGSPVSFTLERNAKDGFGKSLNMETRFKENDFFKAFYNPNLEVPGNTATVTFGEGSVQTFVLQGSSRSSGLDGVNVDEGYAFFQKTNTYDPDLFFDALGVDEDTGLSAGATALATVRQSYNKYARVLLPLWGTSLTDAKEMITTYPADRGISVYWGEFEISNAYSDAYPTFHGIPMGEVAKKHADAIALSYGGLATAWTDENGVGGQLTSGRLLRGLVDPSEAEQKELDEAKINAVLYYDPFGPMIMSRKTTYTDYSDYSFNDFSGAMDYILKNVIKNALPYQLVKMNDATHRNIVRSRVEAVVKPMTVAPYNVIDAYAIKCDSANNNDDIMNQQGMVVELAVRFTSKTDWITFNFINTPYGVEIEEAFN